MIYYNFLFYFCDLKSKSVISYLLLRRYAKYKEGRMRKRGKRSRIQSSYSYLKKSLTCYTLLPC